MYRSLPGQCEMRCPIGLQELARTVARTTRPLSRDNRLEAGHVDVKMKDESCQRPVPLGCDHMQLYCQLFTTNLQQTCDRNRSACHRSPYTVFKACQLI